MSQHKLAHSEKLELIAEMELGNLRFREKLLQSALEICKANDAEDGIREYTLQLNRIQSEIELRCMRMDDLKSERKKINQQIKDGYPELREWLSRIDKEINKRKNKKRNSQPVTINAQLGNIGAAGGNKL